MKISIARKTVKEKEREVRGENSFPLYELFKETGVQILFQLFPTNYIFCIIFNTFWKTKAASLPKAILYLMILPLYLSNSGCLSTSYYVSLHHIMSLYIILCLSTSYYVSLHLIMSLYIIMCLFISYYVSLNHIMSLYIILCLSTSYYVSLYHNVSLYIILCLSTS